MDGNRRWATERGLPKLEGHRRGVETYKQLLLHANTRGVEHLVVYMFSTENWHRAPVEVDYLMNLFRTLAKKELAEPIAENIRSRFVGERERLAPDLQELIADAEERSAKNTGLTAWICLSYSGRAEIVAAANKLIEEGREVVSEEDLRGAMWTAGMPDPDLIIRTSGEQRLSGFLLWQSTYSELFFTDTYWPDFSPAELDRILVEYALRERRHGK